MAFEFRRLHLTRCRRLAALKRTDRARTPARCATRSLGLQAQKAQGSLRVSPPAAACCHPTLTQGISMMPPGFPRGWGVLLGA